MLIRTSQRAEVLTFDSRWVPPVGGAPSRHTGTGGATDGVHAQCLRDPGAGDRSRVAPRAAARRSRVVPRSKQLGSQTRRRRAEQVARQAARRGVPSTRGDARAARSGGRAQEGRRQPHDEVTGFLPHWKKVLTVYPGGFEGSTSRTLGLTDPFLGLCEASFTTEIDFASAFNRRS
jgi:hypothetical protein